jgi:hypothetical protein
MKGDFENPFHITKSNDLTDEQIDQLWVTSADGDGVTGLARPSSPMAMFILGGKGSGKSHLMRYYSFSLQAIRHKKTSTRLVDGLVSDKYIGIYAKCDGLNSERFTEKDQPAKIWDNVFAYYFELWVADKTLEIIDQLLGSVANGGQLSANIANGVASLFDRPIGQFNSIEELRVFLTNLRHDIDYAVNNASLTKSFTAEILVTRGRLFFGIPKVCSANLTSLNGIRFVYLLDEFENFSIEQQKYINTLIREREGPISFKVGSRLYGIKTQKTLSGGERNLEGSEFEELRLDERFRNNPAGYKLFALKLIARRLGAAFGSDAIEHNPQSLSDYFEESDFGWDSPFFTELCNSESLARPHIDLFSQKLIRGVKEGAVVGVKGDAATNNLVTAICFPQYPLIEKLCLLYLYQQWFRSADLLEAAHHVREQAKAYIEGRAPKKFTEFVTKHKGDMVAQLLRENGREQIYAGLNNFIRMSEGLPRALVTILKHIYDWAIYTQERPFSGGRISLKTQRRGITEAASWFLDHMLEEGADGVLVRSGLERLAQLLRTNRFADKPIETSLVAFSVNLLQLEEEARRTLEQSQNTSLLLNISRGQRERNSEQVTTKLELNFMLSPLWDLPIARRGVATLSPAGANSVFVFSQRDQFAALLRNWEAKMTAPFFGRTSGKTQTTTVQTDLFE